MNSCCISFSPWSKNTMKNCKNIRMNFRPSSNKNNKPALSKVRWKTSAKVLTLSLKKAKNLNKPTSLYLNNFNSKILDKNSLMNKSNHMWRKYKNWEVKCTNGKLKR